MALPGKNLPPDTTPKGGRVMLLDIGTVKPAPNQPRPAFEFDGPDLAELAASIKKFGVLQPITVETGDGPAQFRVIMGERRLRAAKMAGLTQIPSILGKPAPADEREIQQIHENLQRKAFSTEALITAVERQLAAGKKQGEIADAFNVRKEVISRYATLAKAPGPLRDLAKVVAARALYTLTRLNEKHPDAVAQFITATKPDDIDHGTVAAFAATLDRPAVTPTTSSDTTAFTPALADNSSAGKDTPASGSQDDEAEAENERRGSTGSSREPSARPDREPSAPGLGGLGGGRPGAITKSDDAEEAATVHRKPARSFKVFCQVGEHEMELDLAATAIRQDGECVLLDALGEPVTAPLKSIVLVEVRAV